MNNLKTAARSLTVIGAVLISVGGISYAALQSQPAKLTGNTIETATASLQLSTDGTNFSSSLPGFDFNNIVPGGSPQSSSFTFRNNGSIPVALHVAVSSTPINPNDVDLSKVNVTLTPAGNPAQTFNLAALMAANNNGGLLLTNPTQLFVGNRLLMTIQVSMAADALTGPSATIGNIDFAFTGTAVTS